MGRSRMLVFCRLLLLLLTVMDLRPSQITASTLPSGVQRRQKKSIMDLQLSSLPSSPSSEEENDELEEDDNESLDEANLMVNNEAEEEEEEEKDDSTSTESGEFSDWSSNSQQPIHSSFRERQIANLINPITSTVTKRSTSRHKPLMTFFSEREREHESRMKRPKKQSDHSSQNKYISVGPNPSRVHQMARFGSQRKHHSAQQPQHHQQQQNHWYPSAYKIIPDLEVNDDEETVIVPLVNKKSNRFDNTDYDHEEDEDNDDGDYGLETSKEDEEEAIDAALKHLSWQRLTKRLIQLEGLQGPYFDRGERSRLYRRTIKKRSSSSSSSSSSLARNYQHLNPNGEEEKKELEDILSDDKTAVKLKRSYSEAAKKVSSIIIDTADNGNGSKINETAIKEKINAKQQLATTVASGKQEVSEKDKAWKGKQWVPYDDSERTLRSKKSWDQYFGVDKRSIMSSGDERGRHSAHQKTLSNSHNEDKGDETKGEEVEENSGGGNKRLQDELIKWYLDRVLLKSNLGGVKEHNKHMKEIVKETGEENDDDDDEDKRKKKSLIKKNEKEIVGIDVWSKQVDERLRRMEDNLLAGATKLLEKEIKNGKISKGDDDDSVTDKTEREVITHLKAAFSLEKMRDALEELQESVGELEETRFEEEEERESEEDDKKKKKNSQPASKNSENDQKEEDKKKKKSVKKKRVIEPSELSMAFGSQLNGPRDLSVEVASPVYLSNNAAASGSDLFASCPLMMNALEYCEELSGVLGEMGKVLLRSCVEHMLCYSCYKSPESCNGAFLQEVESLCDDDFRCQAIAGAMRSVFLSNHDEFRRRNNDLCEIDQCFDRLLQNE